MRRLPGLDLLRAIAILWVMLFHAMSMGLISDSNRLARDGWMGVDLFFALSGFLIGGQLLAPYARGAASNTALFYGRRLFRTLPLYLLVLAFYLTVPTFRERPKIQPLWQFLTFTENLFIDVTGGRAFSHVWSLCIEEQFYLIAPAAVWLLMRRPSAWRAGLACAAVVIGGMAWRAHIWFADLAPLRHAADLGPFYRLWQERIYYSTPSRLDGLLFGVAFAAIKTFEPRLWAGLMARANLLLAAGLALAAGAIVLFLNEQGGLPTIIGYPILSLGLACLVAAGASERSLIGRWRLPGAGLIAAMAYSLYLVHKQAYHLVQLITGDALTRHPLLTALTYAGAALAAGAVLYVGVERPALILRDQWLGRGTGG